MAVQTTALGLPRWLTPCLWAPPLKHLSQSATYWYQCWMANCGLLSFPQWRSIPPCLIFSKWYLKRFIWEMAHCFAMAKKKEKGGWILIQSYPHYWLWRPSVKQAPQWCSVPVSLLPSTWGHTRFIWLSLPDSPTDKERPTDWLRNLWINPHTYVD